MSRQNSGSNEQTGARPPKTRVAISPLGSSDAHLLRPGRTEESSTRRTVEHPTLSFIRRQDRVWLGPHQQPLPIAGGQFQATATRSPKPTAPLPVPFTAAGKRNLKPPSPTSTVVPARQNQYEKSAPLNHPSPETSAPRPAIPHLPAWPAPASAHWRRIGTHPTAANHQQVRTAA